MCVSDFSYLWWRQVEGGLKILLAMSHEFVAKL